MRRALPRLLVPLVIVAGVAAFAVLSHGSDGEPGATEASIGKALVDPEGKPAAVPRRPDVILLVLDQFTSDGLLAPDGRIDAVRYPNFASLARHSYWFPNAWSAYDSTPKATPLILDGIRPYKGQHPDTRSHRRTIFDMFGRRGYGMVTSEEATAICPRRFCRNARRRRPAILPNLRRGRVERLERFFARVRPRRRPTFYMKHVLLPHEPYLFLPSGARTRESARDPVPGMNAPEGFHELFLTHHNYQRYLLQLGFTDFMLGKLLERLVSSGMFDSTMIVVTADHGFAWEVGVKDRRKVNEHNVDEIVPVPLFIKAAGQRQGRVERSYASTLDITPTIADLLNFRLPYRADGRSAFSKKVRGRRIVSLPTRSFDRIIRISVPAFERRRRANVRRRLQLFGSGLTGLFSGIGPHRELIGRQVVDLRVAAPGRVRARIARAGELLRVRRGSGVVPSQIAGDLRGGRRGQRRDFAVAVNGRIEAVGRTFYLRGDRREYFGAMVPEGVLLDGRNAIEVFQVIRGRTLRRLARV